MIPNKNWSTMRKLMLLGAMAGGKAVEDTATGNPLTFLTELARPLKSLLIPFSPIQTGSGDPSPENIRPILPWDGLTVFGGGKNLFNVNSSFQNPSDTTYESNTKRIFAPFTYCIGLSATNYFNTSKVIGYSIQDNALKLTDNGGYGIGFALPLKAGKRYSIQCEGTNFRVNGAFYAKDGSLISTQNSILYEGTRPSYQFVVPENAEMSVIVFVCKTSGQEATFRNVQIEYADTATAYEPYKPITETDIVFPSPVYGGTLDVVSGVMTVNYGIVDLGTFDYDIEPTTDEHNFFVRYNAIPGAKKVGNNTLSSYLCGIYKTVKGTEIYFGLSGDYAISMVDSESPGIRIRDDRFNTASEIKTALNGVMLYYELATPQTVQLTSEQITAIKGSNTMWSDGDSMTAVYLKKA